MSSEMSSDSECPQYVLYMSSVCPLNFLKRLCLRQIARKVGCWRSNEDEMLACLKLSDPVGLTMAGKIDVFLLLGKGKCFKAEDPA